MKKNLDYKILVIFCRNLNVAFDGKTMQFALANKKYDLAYVTRKMHDFCKIKYLTEADRRIYVMKKENLLKIIKSNPELAVEIMTDGIVA